ncbi:hypothetical protein VNO77_27106 [Canavalia gladiata]|uniref:Uncharacterized protein n=1 Tax=Canavalia gladiata TaxID=3824 RepID=A0AAN9KU62_CANGL
MLLSTILLNHMANKNPSFSMCWKPNAKSPDGDVHHELFCSVVNEKPNDMFLYVIDAADYENLPVSRSELHDLLSKPSLNGIPVLILGNKIDKPEAFSKQDLTEKM